MSESIYITAEHELLRDQVRRFVADEVEPVAAAWEESGFVPREVLRKMGSLGFFGLMYDPVYGGSGPDPVTNLVFAEALSQSTFGGFIVTVLVHTDMASPHLYHAGNAEQLARSMPKIISGEAITAVAVTEPDAGSDVASIRTRDERSGDEFVLNGTKMFITNGVLADIYFVAAKTQRPADGKGSGAISMFIVEKGTPGFRVGRALKKSGWLSSDTAELVFEDCRIPAANLLGRENDGFYSVMKNFQNERLMCGAIAVGHATQAIGMTLEHLKTRQAFGQPLWDKQAIRHRLALLQVRTEALRSRTYTSAWLMKEQRDCVREISGLKALSGELVNEVVYACQQFHGGMGYMRESAIERLLRDWRV